MARGFLLLSLVSCSEEQSQTYLNVDLVATAKSTLLAINQPIVVFFDEKLQRPVRSSAVQIVDASGEIVVGYDVRVVGNTLQILGSLPTTPTLEDSTFLPGQHYTVTLRGLPAVASLRSEQASFLAKDIQFGIGFLPLSTSGVLSAFDANIKPLFVVNYSPGQTIDVSSKAALRFNVDGAIDPRTLSFAKLFVSGNKGLAINCNLHLISNKRFSSVIEVELPSFRGTAYLALPSTIEGISARSLAEETSHYPLVSNN
tara:strand:- start:478 stop:1248 length:771 start_codon:yes stop_codon:yes gene_type:complete